MWCYFINYITFKSWFTLTVPFTWFSMKISICHNQTNVPMFLFLIFSKFNSKFWEKVSVFQSLEKVAYSLAERSIKIYKVTNFAANFNFKIDIFSQIMNIENFQRRWNIFILYTNTSLFIVWRMIGSYKVITRNFQIVCLKMKH